MRSSVGDERYVDIWRIIYLANRDKRTLERLPSAASAVNQQDFEGNQINLLSFGITEGSERTEQKK